MWGSYLIVLWPWNKPLRYVSRRTFGGIFFKLCVQSLCFYKYFPCFFLKGTIVSLQKKKKKERREFRTKVYISILRDISLDYTKDHMTFELEKDLFSWECLRRLLKNQNIRAKFRQFAASEECKKWDRWGGRLLTPVSGKCLDNKLKLICRIWKLCECASMYGAMCSVMVFCFVKCLRFVYLVMSIDILKFHLFWNKTTMPKAIWKVI